MADNWGQQLMNFSDFIDKYLSSTPPTPCTTTPRDSGTPAATSTALDTTPPATAATASNQYQATASPQHDYPALAYLAQHQLFDQIRVLRNDIDIPDLCALHDLPLRNELVARGLLESPRPSSRQRSDRNTHAKSAEPQPRSTDISSTATLPVDASVRGPVDSSGSGPLGNREHQATGLVPETACHFASNQPGSVEQAESAETVTRGCDLIEGSSQGQDPRKRESEEPGEEEDIVTINGWFGPAETVSCCHHDPMHNLLVQVVGSKRVTLFPPGPAASRGLYPNSGRQSNTSQVDIEAPQLDKYPLFAELKPIVFELQEGDTLYIPPGWWHHVRSLEISMSVSFWWT